MLGVAAVDRHGEGDTVAAAAVVGHGQAGEVAGEVELVVPVCGEERLARRDRRLLQVASTLPRPIACGSLGNVRPSTGPVFEESFPLEPYPSFIGIPIG